MVQGLAEMTGCQKRGLDIMFLDGRNKGQDDMFPVRNARLPPQATSFYGAPVVSRKPQAKNWP